MRVLIKHCLRRHDLSVLTESTLRHLFLNPGLLQRVQLSIRCKPFERGDFSLDRRHGHDAGTNRRTVDNHRAGAALTKSASKARPLQAEVVTKDVEERRGGLDVQRMRTAVHLKFNLAHRWVPPFLLRLPPSYTVLLRSPQLGPCMGV